MSSDFFLVRESIDFFMSFLISLRFEAFGYFYPQNIVKIYNLQQQKKEVAT